MSDEMNDQTTEPDTTPSAFAQMADAIAAGVGNAIAAAQPKKKITIADRPIVKSPFNPTGQKRVLPFPAFQNLTRINPYVLSKPEFDLMVQLETTLAMNRVRGQLRCCQGAVNVWMLENETGQRELHLGYKNGTMEQRLGLTSALGGRGLLAMLEGAVAAVDEEIQAEEDRPRGRRRR